MTFSATVENFITVTWIDWMSPNEGKRHQHRRTTLYSGTLSKSAFLFLREEITASSSTFLLDATLKMILTAILCTFMSELYRWSGTIEIQKLKMG